MAEKVEYRQELKLPFYEDLKNSGVLNRNKNTGEGTEGKAGDRKGSTDVIDIKELMHQEESFEIKINSPLKSVNDFYEYILFKKTLYAKLCELRKGNSNTRAQQFVRIIRIHIKKLYNEGLSFFPEHLGLWEAYIDFCKNSKFYTDGSTAYEKMLTYHGKPELWLKAVQYECEYTKNVEKAKNLLLSAIQMHANNSELYITLFEKLLSTAGSEESADYRLALAVYENSKTCDFKIDYWAKVLEVAQKYRFTKKLQGLLVGYMVEKFINSELVWHILAQRELKGFPTGDIIKQCLEKRFEDPNPEDESHMDEESHENFSWCEVVHSEHRMKLCAEIYQAALSVVNTEKMWTYYIDTMLKLNEESTNSDKVLKRKLLGEAFSGASQAKLLTENHFRAYVDLLSESGASNDAIPKLVNRGLDLYPESVMPWELLMHHYIIKDKEDKVKEIFDKACKELKDPERAYPLWRIMLRYNQTLPDKYESVYNLFAKACTQPSPKFLPMRVLYLEFCMINQSVEYVRKVYNELSAMPPPYLELHKRMALFESHLLNPDITNWRKCHQNAVEFFGKKRSDVWIDYIDFEKFYGDASKISQIYKEAISVMEGNMKQKFQSDYNIFSAIKRIDLTEDEETNK